MEYTALKRPALLQLCREKHISHYSNKTKQELIQLLLKVAKPAQPKKILPFAPAVLRHYYMYPLLTTALFASRGVHKEAVHPHPSPPVHE